MNKMTLKTTAIGLLFSSTSLFNAVLAQTESDSLQMDVTFVGEREMVVKDAIKLQSWPELKRLETGKREFDYKLLSKRLNVNPTWSLVDPVRLRVDAPLSRLYRGYARAGYGLYNTPLLEVSLTDLRSREGTWGIQGSHFATTPSKLIDNRYADSGARVWVSRFLGKEKVDLEANINTNNIVYYGNVLVTDTIVNGSTADSTYVMGPDTAWGSPDQRYTTFGGSISFKSHQRDSTKLNHRLDLRYTQLRDRDGTIDNNFSGDFEAGKFVENNKFTLEGQFNVDKLHVGYDNPDTIKTDQAVVGLIPTATSYRGPLTVKVGAGLWVDADAQSRIGEGSTFHFYPIVEASMRLLKDVFVPYLRVGGGLEQNRLETILDKNPFYYAQVNGDMRTTSRKGDIHLGMRGTLTEKVSFNVRASTTTYEDYMYFKNDVSLGSGNRFTAFYDTLNVKTVGGDIHFDMSEDLEFGLYATAYSYDAKGLEAAWNLPSFEAKLELNYTFLDKFKLTSTTTIVGDRTAISDAEPHLHEYEEFADGLYKVNLPTFADVNLSLEYRYNERTSVWANVNNALGTNYRYWVSYPVQGTQAMLGASYAF